MTLRRNVALLSATLVLTMSASAQAFADGTSNGEEKRWSKVIPATQAVPEQRWHLAKTIPAQDKQEVKQYKYMQTIPETPKKTHDESLFRKAVPHSHSEYQRRTRDIRQRWSIGLTYAQDVYNGESVPAYQDSVQYKYDKYVSNRNWFTRNWEWIKVWETEWGERQTTGSLDILPTGYQELLANEQTRTEKVQTGSELKYSKIISKGDRHPTRYGPYDVFADPIKVGFTVGSSQRLVDKAFDLGEHAFDAAGNDIVIQYVFRQVAGPVTAGHTEWSNWTAWSADNPGTASDVKEIQTRTIKDPDTWVYLDANQQKVDDKAKATWHRASDPIKESGWEAFKTKQEVDQEFIAESTIYLMANNTTTLDAELAEWIDTPPDEMNNWSPMLDDQGQPVVNTVSIRPESQERTVYLDSIGLETDDKAEAGWFTATSEVDSEGYTKADEETYETSPIILEHTVYYVPGGEPTTTLGESNWTGDVPKGWTLVDTRNIGSRPGNESGTFPAYNIEAIFLGVGCLLFAGLAAWILIVLRRRQRSTTPFEVVTGTVLDATSSFPNPSATSDASKQTVIRLDRHGHMQ